MGLHKVTFPWYSNFEMIKITHDVVEYTSTNRQLLYDTIIWRETLKEPNAVLDFKNFIMEINSVT